MFKNDQKGGMLDSSDISYVPIACVWPSFCLRPGGPNSCKVSRLLLMEGGHMLWHTETSPLWYVYMLCRTDPGAWLKDIDGLSWSCMCTCVCVRELLCISIRLRNT